MSIRHIKSKTANIKKLDKQVKYTIKRYTGEHLLEASKTMISNRLYVAPGDCWAMRELAQTTIEHIDSEKLKQNFAIFIAYDDSGKAIGACTTRENWVNESIANVFVRQKMRSGGIGGEMLQAAKRFTKRTGNSLEAFEGRYGTHKFFMKNGVPCEPKY